jgi:pSer/pThr/pTyr-binding forkhead associated (FHA) protein
MQKCWNCGAEQFDGTIFCLDCGASLIGDQGSRRETTASLGQNTLIPEDVAKAIPTEPTVVPEPDSAPVGTKGKEFCLVVLNSGQRLLLEPERNLLVGRKDKNRNIFPDVDIAEYGGYDAGVSRRHALLSLHNGHCILEDLSSANGTFVNNRRLAPNQPTSVNDGDEIKFGTLLLRIEFDQQA